MPFCTLHNSQALRSTWWNMTTRLVPELPCPQRFHSDQRRRASPTKLQKYKLIIVTRFHFVSSLSDNRRGGRRRKVDNKENFRAPRYFNNESEPVARCGSLFVLCWHEEGALKVGNTRYATSWNSIKTMAILFRLFRFFFSSSKHFHLEQNEAIK